MEGGIFDALGIDAGIILIILMIIMVIMIVYMVKLSFKMTRFLKKYKIFMRGQDGASLEKSFMHSFNELD